MQGTFSETNLHAGSETNEAQADHLQRAAPAGDDGSQGRRRRHRARHRELEIHERVLPQRRQSRLSAVHGVLLPRSGEEARFRGARRRPASRDGFDLDRGRARLRDGGIFHRRRRPFLQGFLRSRARHPQRTQRQGPDDRDRGREPDHRLSPAARSDARRQQARRRRARHGHGPHGQDPGGNAPPAQGDRAHRQGA